MLLVDTNVVAYLLIEGDHTKAAKEIAQPAILTGAAKLSCSSNSRMFSLFFYRDEEDDAFAWLEDFLAKAVALFDGKLASHSARICTGGRRPPPSQRL